VARIRGVSPRVAVIWVGETDTILLRKSLSSNLPGAVRRLFQAPGCRAGDAPITLEGPWTGILGANGKTELDMRPPYDVGLRVAHASARRYLRASLTVRVPASLGSPLSKSDLRDSLRAGGTIRITATCSGGRFVAERVRAFPPA
jgi:hypothetical protein